MAETVKVKGLKELDRALGRLEQKTRRSVLGKALRRAIKPMRQTAKNNALAIADAGALAAAMGSWTKSGRGQVGGPDGKVIKDKRSLTVFIGPRSKNKKAVKLWNQKHGTDVTVLKHGYLAEFEVGAHGGGHRYMTRAYDAHKIQTVSRLAKEIRREIDKVRAVPSGR